ncbi:MAG: hypothetical protein FJ221_11660 [Lentisphaerae bacterium]|nr:hypothetical protein [Lentisphaerota bacterium]
MLGVGCWALAVGCCVLVLGGASYCEPERCGLERPSPRPRVARPSIIPCWALAVGRWLLDVA